MGEITPDHVEEYIRSLLPADEFMEALEEKATDRGIPIVGHAEGFLLYLLVRATRSASVLEIGAAIGYSAIWMARGLGEGGLLYTIERDAGLAAEAVKNLGRAGLADKAEVLVGEATELLPSIKQQFDFIFNDADKGEYPGLLKLMLPRLNKGGLLVTDNALWGGSAAKNERDSRSIAIRKYNKMLSENPKLETTIIPVRDGVSIALKR